LFIQLTEEFHDLLALAGGVRHHGRFVGAERTDV
jgi:hypothetical protein